MKIKKSNPVKNIDRNSTGRYDFVWNNLSTSINNTRDLMWSVDRKYKLVSSNSAFNESIKQIIGKSISPGDDVLTIGFTSAQLIRYKELYDRAFGGETFKVIEYNEKPVEFWSELSFYPIYNGENVEGTDCYSHDITDQKMAEEKVLIKQRLYSFLSQINQAISHSTDEKTLFKKSCQIAIEIGKFELAWIGKPDELTKKMNIIEYLTTEKGDIEFFSNLVYTQEGPTAQVMKNGTPYIANDFEHNAIDSSTKDYAIKRGFKSFIVLPLMKSNITIGTFNLFSCNAKFFNVEEIRLLTETAGDISFGLDLFEKEKSRRQLDEKIKHTKLRLMQAQTIAHVGSWEFYFSDGFSIWSDEECRIYGLLPGDNKQSFEIWQSFIHPEDYEITMKIVNESLATSEATSFYHRIIRSDGSVRHLHSQNQFDFNSDGKSIGIFGVSHDITDEKESEKIREKMIEDIVQRNKDLEQFSYIVSHNLRGQVAKILGISDLILNKLISENEMSELINNLYLTTTNLDNVIKDINSILNLKHNGNKKKEIVVFSDILNAIKHNISSTIKSENAIIQSDFSEINEFVSLKVYIYSIFLNLISNGIKYRQKNINPIIEITSFKTGNKLLISFKDNGLGIDLNKQGAKVFGLYNRFHTQMEGKGMGLFMVKTQVESLGGKITLNSEVNIGSEFKIEFDIN